MTSRVTCLAQASVAVVFTRSQCPCGARAVALLEALTSDVSSYDLDVLPDGVAIHKELATAFQHESLPAVFLSGRLIGGFADLDAMHKDGKTAALLV